MRRSTLVPLLAGICAAAGAGACGGSGGPTLDRAALLDPQTCQSCHPSQFQDWSGSMHAYASDDPVFRAMNQRVQRENPQAGPFCLQCHAPMAVRDGLTVDGSNLDQVPQTHHGVTCYFCHSAESVAGTHNNPLTLSTDGSLFGPFGDPVAGTPHKAAYSALLDDSTTDSANMCGSCHDIQNLQQAHVERTFAEWQQTLFAVPPNGTTCAQCHMPGSNGPASTVSTGKVRRVHSHVLAGVDLALTAGFPQKDAQKASAQDFLDRTLQATLCLDPSANSLQLTFDNVGAGHGFPSGATPDRRAWVEVTAYAGGNAIYSSGGAGPAPAASTPDPDLWLIRDCIYDQLGSEQTMFWRAATVASNQLPGPMVPSQHTQKIYPDPTRVPGGLPSAPDRVTVAVHLQAIGDDVLSDLVQSGDLDASVPPLVARYDLGGGAALEWTPASATVVVNPTTLATLLCVTTGNYWPTTVPAVSHAACPAQP
jgi:hypothetical protein